jgi:sugar phosphate isomerase/epimerase
VFRVVPKRAFGVSTSLYHGRRLSRDHLHEIAAHGFEVVELAAAPGHFDCRNTAVVAELQQWLAEAALELSAVHAPVAATLEDLELALFIARRIPIKTFVMRLEGSRETARRSVERLARAAEPLGVRVALHVESDPLGRPGSLVHFVESEVASAAGICFDFGHAHLGGDVVEALETVAEHLIAAHVHDNRGRSDEHLVPLDGAIDWPAALTAVQKIGYDGPLIMELRPQGSTKETLARARKARERLERMLAQ